MAALPSVLGDFAPVALMLLDDELRIVWASETTARSMKQTVDGMTGRHLRDVQRPGMLTDDVVAVLITGLERRVDAVLAWGDGRERDVVVFPVDVAGRRCIGFAAVLITAAVHRTLDEHELRESLLADAARLGVWRHDLRDGSVRGNSWFRIIHDVGTPAAPRSRAELATRIHPDDRDLVRATIDQAVAAGEPYSMTYRLVGPNGEAKTVQSRGSVVPGRPHELIGVVMDVTAAETAAAREAELQREALAASDAERDRIAADIHDGPLQALSAAWLRLTTLATRLDGRADDDDAELARLARDVARSLAETNQELRDVLGRLRSLPVDSSVDTFAHHVGDLADDLHERGEAEFSVEVDAGPRTTLPGLVLATAYRIVAEAMINASAHSGAHRIDVAVRAEGDVLVITVADDGSGFDTAAPAPSGHFGLSIMRQRAEGLQGSLAVHSAPGQGTRVVALLPLDPIDADAAD